MGRVTALEVKGIIETTLTDAEVLVYVTSANTMVNSVLGEGTTDILKEIERWLTAHMIACTKEQQTKEEGAGGAYVKYAQVFGQNLSSTSYGQMVLTLDQSGRMASLGGKIARMIAIKNFD